MHNGNEALEPIYSNDVIRKLNAAVKVALEGIDPSPESMITSIQQSEQTNPENEGGVKTI